MTAESVPLRTPPPEPRRYWHTFRPALSAWTLAWLACALVFAALSAWAFTHTLFPGEQSLAHWQQNHPHHPPLFSPEMFVDFIGGPMTLGVLTGIGVLLFLVLRRWDLLALVIAAPLLMQFGLLMKIIIRRPRPALDEVIGIRGSATGFSFPSGHTLQATIICVMTIIIAQQLLTGRLRRMVVLGAVWLPAAVGFERVFDGVHWPTDVLGGVLLGVLVTTAVWHLIGMTPLRPAATGVGIVSQPHSAPR
jgi:undecaprenyl-diphosphatase